VKPNISHCKTFFLLSKNQTKKCAIHSLLVTMPKYFTDYAKYVSTCALICSRSHSKWSDVDNGYRTTWGYCAAPTNNSDKPIQADNLQHFLQLYASGYHQFSSHIPKGMIVADLGFLSNRFKGHCRLYKEWYKVNTPFISGSVKYNQYMK